MNGEMIAVFGIPTVVFLISALVGHGLARARSTGGLITSGVMLLGFTGIMFFGMDQASGWDALPYMLALLGLCAPGGAGFGLGGLVGWLRGGKETYA